MRKKDDFYDDGRTIASMSGVERPNLFVPKMNTHGDRNSSVPDSANNADGSDFERDRPWDQSGRLSKEETRWYALGALRAALLIGLAFIVGLGAAILLMILIWG